MNWKLWAGGLALALAFIPHGIWVLGVPGLFLLMSYAAESGSLKRVLYRSIISSVLVSAIKFIWIPYAAVNLLMCNWFTAIGLLLLYGLVSAPQIIGLCVGAYFVRKYNYRWEIGVALILIALVLDFAPWKFMYDDFSVNYNDSLPLMHAIGVGGKAIILSFFTIASAVIFFYLPRKPAVFGISAFWIALYSLGYIQYQKSISVNTSLEAASEVRLNIGFVQPSSKNFIERILEIPDPVAAGNIILDEYISLSEAVIEKNPNIDFMVWPETAYPFSFGDEIVSKVKESLDLKLRAFILKNGIPLIFGLNSVSNDGRDQNSVYHVEPVAGELKIQKYHKSNLFPMGENVPIFGKNPVLAKLFGYLGNSEAGDGPVIFDVALKDGRRVRVGPLICYEALIPSYVAKYRKLNPDLLLNLTNDSWFGKFIEPEQHLSYVRPRSIEVGIPLVRVAKTGITAYIKPTGGISYRTGVYERIAEVITVPLIDNKLTF